MVLIFEPNIIFSALDNFFADSAGGIALCHLVDYLRRPRRGYQDDVGPAVHVVKRGMGAIDAS